MSLLNRKTKTRVIILRIIKSLELETRPCIVVTADIPGLEREDSLLNGFSVTKIGVSSALRHIHFLGEFEMLNPNDIMRIDDVRVENSDVSVSRL